MAIYIRPDNSPDEVFEQHYTLRCPHCGIRSNMSAISIPRFEYLARFKPKTIGICYRCDSCNAPVFLRFKEYASSYDGNGQYFAFQPEYAEVERFEESYDLARLPNDVAEDFKEALKCYSAFCFNAFAAMCRRTVQSTAAAMGAAGKDRVLKQIEELKEMAHIDDETFTVLKEIVIAGHDGAHPHLPSLSPDRAAILLELMKDVLYQLFIRKKLLEEAGAKRAAQIQKKK